MAMEMDHSFTVPVPPDRAWDVLLDVERIAPCMPGASVDEFDGEVVTGRIKVKVGPVSLTYRGTAKFTERDADAKVIVLEASGKETRGAGTASATVRASLEPEPGGEGDHGHHAHDDERDRPAGPVRPRGDGRGRRQAGGAVRPEPAPADRRGRRGGRERPPPTAAAGTGTAERRRQRRPGHRHDAGRAGQHPAVARRSRRGHYADAIGASPPAASADSINLVKLVGPALLKRVIPVVVVAAVLALLGRRLFRRGAKD